MATRTADAIRQEHPGIRFIRSAFFPHDSCYEREYSGMSNQFISQHILDGPIEEGKITRDKNRLTLPAQFLFEDLR
jgi:hypothetical protein